MRVARVSSQLAARAAGEQSAACSAQTLRVSPPLVYCLRRFYCSAPGRRIHCCIRCRFLFAPIRCGNGGRGAFIACVSGEKNGWSVLTLDCCCVALTLSDALKWATSTRFPSGRGTVASAPRSIHYVKGNYRTRGLSRSLFRLV